MIDEAEIDRRVLSRGPRSERSRRRPGTRQLFAPGAGSRSDGGVRRACRSAPGVGYFFPRPSAGSACKRLNLFLRWMVRRDASISASGRACRRRQLVVPLDTHVIRVGRCLRLTRYTSPGWRMAQDITASLRRLDPSDPVQVRLLALSSRDDERLRVQPRPAGCAVSAAWGVPATRA